MAFPAASAKFRFGKGADEMKKEKEWNYGRISIGSRTFDICNAILMILLCVVTLYPMWFVLCASFSDPETLVTSSGVVLYPLNFSTVNYHKVLAYTPIWQGYWVTIRVVVLGTTLNLLFTSLLAYVLSRKNLMLKKLITGLCVFTMYFSGGMIPTFMVVKGIGLYNNLWALIFPGLISTYNAIVIRTAMQGVPDELAESASLDGANELVILFRIILPMVKPTLAAIALFCAVGHWNSYFDAMIYLNSPELYNIQLVLRNAINNVKSISENGASDMANMVKNEANGEAIKYVLIVITMIPVMIIYPFVQKYFIKGIMIGSIKG